MPNIVFELHGGKKFTVTEEEFNRINLSEILKDNMISYVDLGPRGFQKGNISSWDYEKVEETTNE